MTTAPHGAPDPAPLIAHLASFGERRALVTADGTVSYADLARRVEEVAATYAGGRRLVLLTPGNDVDSVVEYVAALAAEQVVLVSSPAAAPGLEQAYAPDVVAGPQGREWRSEESRHALHPDLALLLSTSGSTGSPKLVRLWPATACWPTPRPSPRPSASATTDVAATTLPAALLLRPLGAAQPPAARRRAAAHRRCPSSTSASGTWSATHGVTTIPGVPHTFELLDRGRLRRPRRAVRCATSPRPAAGWRPSGCARSPSSASAAASTSS